MSLAGNTDPNIASFSPAVQRPHRRRAAHALAAHLAGVPAQAPAGGGLRRLLRTRSRVPRRRGRRAPQPRVHDARVVPRWAGTTAPDRRNRRAGAGGAGAGRSHARRCRASRYHELYRQRLGIDPHTRRATSNLRAALGDVVIDPAGLIRDDWLDLLMTHRLQPSFAADQLLAVYDYPASQCALARIRDGTATAAGRRTLRAVPGPAGTGQRLPRAGRCGEQGARFDRDLRRAAGIAATCSRRATSACSRRWRPVSRIAPASRWAWIA